MGLPPAGTIGLGRSPRYSEKVKLAICTPSSHLFGPCGLDTRSENTGEVGVSARRGALAGGTDSGNSQRRKVVVRVRPGQLFPVGCWKKSRQYSKAGMSASRPQVTGPETRADQRVYQVLTTGPHRIGVVCGYLRRVHSKLKCQHIQCKHLLPSSGLRLCDVIRVRRRAIAF
jgi:hypothetical protein